MPRLSSLLTTLRTRGFGTTVQASVNAARIEAGRLMGQRFVERPIYDYRMLLDLEDRGISRTLLLFGRREMEHKLMLEQVLQPAMTVLDIGANIGYYALMELTLIGQRGKLIAVEPSPSNVALLRRNLALNGYHDIEIHQKAMSDRSGERTFFMSEMSNLNTFHNTTDANLHLSGKTIEVQTATVPEIAAGRQIDLIRMDVEGHEVEVINGLLPAVEKGEQAPMIIFETHLSRYGAEHDIEAPLRRLFACGYRVRLAGSSSERGTAVIEGYGYRGSAPIESDDVKRVIFSDIAPEHAVEMLCRRGGIRTVLLGR
ncbi:FkbM family methyltransferase [Ferrovibrio terrae]|uniref:FkbM family methyltransferase n=1 Tax=Ferrovibrio terrae TaxID=2594003 RepID=UPI003137DEA1